MLIKLNPIFPTYAGARVERVRQQKALTKKQWINVDRIVMFLLFATAIAGTIMFA